MNSAMNLIFSALVLLLWLSAPQSVIVASLQGQKTIVKVSERGDDWQCPSVEERETMRNEIHQIANSAILNATGLIHTCNGTPGWRRVAFINMTDASYDCPTGLNLTSYSKRTRGRSHTIRGGCSSTTFSIGDLSYSRVCGRIKGYQFGKTGAFYSCGSFANINSFYVDGVSLTHGGARRQQHIWTFAVGRSEVTKRFPTCPCDTTSSSTTTAPAFVGNDYFCESGLHSEWDINQHPSVFFSDDVLWDGQNCTSNSTCCQFNNPPWFTKNLPIATIDDIELRICTNGPIAADDVPIELMELYVQ